ncbi:MAG: hypothetical protein GWO87_03380 [Xanthomonadaceae bacterium]|nr:hypothetical protein [Rhodospirillaceae bacterium]NIA18203.1 hypothetical protein [Xanthomonadaceae bacterium]
MNKKILIKKATLLLKQYQEMTSKMRNYDRENWHCVDVKRYHDYTDINKLIKEYPKKYRKELLEEFTENYISGEYGLYYSWLDTCWEQLNYEVSDIENITKGAKDKHKNFEYIKLQGEVKTEDYKTQCDKCHKKTWYEDGHPCMMEGCNGTLRAITYKQEYDDRKMIYSLGRSGGWACFQDNLDYVEDTLTLIIEWDFIDNIFDKEIKNNDDVNYYLNKVDAMIEEVKYIKNYIYNFNAKLDFEEELKSKIEEKITEIDEENKELAENKERLIEDIKINIDKIQSRLDIYKKNKEFKNLIQRHITGITKLLKN